MSESAVDVYNAGGSHPVVLVCEHASACMPVSYQRLGLAKDVAVSHIAWDPGALETARFLADNLNAVLVSGTVSRLIYDLNRPPESPGAMTSRSEKHEVPGNVDLAASERLHRVEHYYRPFVDELARVLTAHQQPPVLVTVHSFTPVYNDEPRDVELGVLHDADARLADVMLEQNLPFNVQRNEPYGPEDGVTHTLKLHGLSRQLLNVMIEIRSDLIADSAACKSMSEQLAPWLNTSLQQLHRSKTAGQRL